MRVELKSLLRFTCMVIVTLMFSHLSLAQSPDQTGDWASFRNGNSLHGVATSSLPDKLTQLWTYDSKDGIPGTPAIVDGHVYCGLLDGYVVCLKLKTGEDVWKYRSIEDVDPKSFAPGFKAAPLVTESSVFIGDEEGIFHCLDRKTGKKKWTHETFGEIVSSASIIDDRIIFGSYDNSLYCLKAETGEELWKFETEGYVNCTPAIINGFTFVTGCDEQLRVIDVVTGEQVKIMPLNTYLIASPAIMGDTLYVGTYASEVIAVNWKNLTTEWAYRAAVGEFPYHSSAALTKELVVVGGRDKVVHAINRLNGEEVWTFATRGKVDSSPVVVGERVFVGSDDGYIYGLELNTGKELWKERIGRKVPGSPAVGEQVLVIGSAETNGKLFAFGQAP
ncbi:beta-alanine-activating enzyme beta-propeller domain-containing protein [Rubinisphaera italica]|uniref:Serine/threonine-protein kinase AfsK n=1 Tax=Rubinisphaera italica TaxID=2527969 RepID=A0A5C5XKH5_9PLAN|nr:PQQ-binding-like beta-propeller repeat protein [Rubinisphaera italica]TWT62242.1 Serine/threonine-protein kinase AfsK [Rubinisphaera italica]